MGLLKDFVRKLKIKKQLERDIEVEQRAYKSVKEKQKSSDQREYERYLEEMRQKAIKKKLQEFRKRQMNEVWKSNMFTHNPYLFKNKVNLGRYY